MVYQQDKIEQAREKVAEYLEAFEHDELVDMVLDAKSDFAIRQWAEEIDELDEEDLVLDA